MFKLVVLCAAVAVASAGYLEPLSYGYSTSTVLKTPIIAPVAHVAYTAPVVVKAPVATSYQSFTKIDKPAIHYAPVHYAAPTIVKAPISYPYHAPLAYAAAPLAYSAPLSYHGYSGYSGYGAYGHHLYK